ncbi:MAG: protein-methionine-sulfoxide reductase heme-binding subunit MsrQ [Granulosicoccus sp.]
MLSRVRPFASGVVGQASLIAQGKRISFSRFAIGASLFKLLVFVVSLLPFFYLVQALLTNNLGANPIEALTDYTGTITIRFLLVSLSLTPLRWLLKKTWPLRLRRMLGLYTFFYASVHFLIYALLDQQLDLAAIGADIAERPYVLAGTTALLLLLPLAFTSTRGWVRRLGKRWQLLHRGVYLAATAAVVHYVWLAKGDLIEPFVYLAVLFVLLAWRLLQLVKTNTR